MESKKSESKDCISEALGEELPEIEDINWEYALRLIPKRKLLFRVLEDFYERADMISQKLSELEKKTDSEEGLEEYRLCVHSLKSTSAMAGILSVSESARRLEEAARDGDVERIHADTPVLSEKLRKVKEHLEPFLKERNGENAGAEEERGDAEKRMG